MPKVVSYDNVKDEIVTLDSVPIGFETTSNCVSFFNFDNLVNLVLYAEPLHGQGFAPALIKILKHVKNSKIVWIDALEIATEIDGVKRYSSSYGNLTKSLYNSIVEKKSSDPNSEKIIFVVSGYGAIQKYLKDAKKDGDEDIHTLDDLIVAAIGSENYKFILMDSADIKSIDSCKWIDYYDYDRGILLARDPSEQEIFDLYYGDNLTMQEINQGIPTMIKYIRN